MLESHTKTFVLLHGAWYRAWCWEKITPGLEAQGYQVISINYPNYIPHTSNKTITLDTYVETVWKEVKNLPDNSIILVGHSMSGIVLTQFVEKYPKKVDRLVFISSFIPRNQESIWDIINERSAGSKGAIKELSSVAGKGHSSFEVMKINSSTIIDRFCGDCGPINLDKFAPYTPLDPIKTLVSFGGNFQKANKFYIYCTQDKAVSPKEQERMMASAGIPIRHIASINSSHSPFLSNPILFTKILLEIAQAEKIADHLKKYLNPEIESFKIGIIRGMGTGNQLADIFKAFLLVMVNKENERREKFKVLPKINCEFVENYQEGNIYNYRSYEGIVKAKGLKDDCQLKGESEKEALSLTRTMQEWYKAGVRIVFRTSINAESLYLYRQKVQAVKEFIFSISKDRKILFIRDQAEGFYANAEVQFNEDQIEFKGRFTKAFQQKLVKHAISRAKTTFPVGFEVWAIYKFHLFGKKLKAWIQEADPSISIETFQPDTGFTKLLSEYIYATASSSDQEEPVKSKNLLLICGNKIGDLIYEIIMGALNLNANLDLFTRNLLLADSFGGDNPSEKKMVEYQTVHGSADDIAAPRTVIPYATLRIAASIAEMELGIRDMREKTDKGIVSAQQNSLKNMDKIVNWVMEYASR